MADLRGGLRSETGQGAMGCIVFIIVLIGVLYAAFQFSRPYIKHSMMEAKMEDLAKWSLENPHYDDPFIIKAILNAAEELSIDLDREDIQVERNKERARIIIRWEDEVRLPKYVRHLEFNVEASREVER